MKTIGLLGGMSWESTVPYYRIINETVRERLGGLHSAKIILYSVDFHEIETRQHTDRWEDAGRFLADAARSIERAGADFLVLCTNTMHKVAPQIQDAIGIPILHIADATAREVQRAGIRTVGLLGTRFTMEEEFYRGHLERKHGLRVLVPPMSDRRNIHRVIFEELCRGEVRERSRRVFVAIRERLGRDGVEGIILACTEIGMLVNAKTSPLPTFDSTEIHARAAAKWALTDKETEAD